MIILTLFLFGFQVSSTDKLQIVRFVTVPKQAECKLLLGHLYSKLHIQLGNFEPRISTVGAKRSLSVEVTDSFFLQTRVDKTTGFLLQCVLLCIIVPNNKDDCFSESFHTFSANLWAKSGCRRLLQNLIKVCNKIESSAGMNGNSTVSFTLCFTESLLLKCLLVSQHEKYRGRNSSTVVFNCWANLARSSA